MSTADLVASTRTPVLITVAGCHSNTSFRRCVETAQALADGFESVSVETLAMTETEWEGWVDSKARELGGAAYDHGSDRPIVLYNGCNYVGGPVEFFGWARQVYEHIVPSTWLQDELLRRAYSPEFEVHPKADSRHTYAYFDLTYGEGKEETKGRVYVELYDELCPRACENFRGLCSGDNENSLSYAGTPIHRVVKGGYIQTGDVIEGHGDAGLSIFGDTFADECFTLSHDAVGIVSMANNGPHTNASQFFVTLRPLKFLDQRFMAFGRVVSGMRHLRAIENLPLANQRPNVRCEIAGGGVVQSSPAEGKVDSKSES